VYKSGRTKVLLLCVDHDVAQEDGDVGEFAGLQHALQLLHESRVGVGHQGTLITKGVFPPGRLRKVESNIA
jgi:hypothetical protein